VIGANRDELLARPWDPPAAYWPDLPDVVAGRDRTAGGTWMAVRRDGLAAAVLNREGSLGPAPGKRSRGELPLLAMRHASGAEAAAALAALDGAAWRSFNMVVADGGGAFFVRSLGQGRPEAIALSPGVHMVTAHDPDDLTSARIARHLPRFRAAAAPEPGSWDSWRELLGDTSADWLEQIDVTPHAGFGTVCSSLVGIPLEGEPALLFAAGPPHAAPFEPIRF
jgi:hypothetical protein